MNRAANTAAGTAASLREEDLRWGPDGLLPAVVQDARTGQVLMLAYMNREALRRTLETGQTWFWSRSRQALWHKGETSGHVQHVREIRTDCDGDTLLVLVEQEGVACHLGTYSCFMHRRAEWPRLADGPAAAPAGSGDHADAPEAVHVPSWWPGAPASAARLGDVLSELAAVLADRRRHPDPGSYTSRLFARAPDAALKKVAEEAGEVLLAAKGADRAGLVWEVADLWFHTLVVLEQAGISLDEIAAELARRRGKRRSGE
ncbi:bifunctional phosphoribosyl-AMP cyclohydrolase/phosphoribosyl-ATP diphosphatase HisIE [Caldinitratiruptor microaerophilus]|uniref:Histidine biosynthesis bifunctional protein HisIE n=1 Tax=Caldinitratiruptor microaerophilus TaxID=671077 RepID=A0AA35G8N8_9FIRM|nr:bifunctional phosphoribosyl-AMP cyclohydrolase/phosphoribosyl-ATP diphosphatase HisIE [Caldinitratiruptor microaerophilus]BDG61266.1 bifunctional phosphoribosyl-AMP cyclohydrolase/phosphoribosyl-ATP diphosphatase [Caldinitratiruptor microaerophilus]